MANSLVTTKEPQADNDSKTSNNSQPIETLNFLKAIWPVSKHLHQIAIRDPRTGYFSNNPVPSPERAIAAAIRESNAGHDTYFAPASFKTSDSRTAANAVEVCCLWVDIDVGKGKAERGLGYSSLDEAIAAVTEFCNTVGIPQPTLIVGTGTGVHDYWVFDRPIGRELWHNLARKFKELAHHFNFLADPSRTADIASVLRIPGTKNYKYHPALPVEIMSSSEQLISVDDIAEIIFEAHRRLIGASKEKTVVEIQPCSINKLALLKTVLALLDPDMDYLEWFRVAAVIFNETGGDNAGFKLFDEWSCRGKKYRGTQETGRKWRSLNPKHPNPLGMGTLRRMVEDQWYDWHNDCVAVAAMSEPHEEVVAA